MSFPHPLTSRLARGTASALTMVLLAGGLSACDASSTSAEQTTKEAERPLSPREESLVQAAKLVDKMSLAEQAGQVLVPAWNGGSPPIAEIKRLHLGGIIALPEGTMAPEDAKRANAEITRAFRSRGYPAFLSVDQEGGSVARVRDPLTQQPDFMAAGAAASPTLTRKVARATAAELRGLGFTVVFAPDADVTIGPSDPAIGTRSAGDNPQKVATQVVAAARGIESVGVIPVLKHFPGHGSVTTDSHVATPVQRRSLKQLQRHDLIPFKRAVVASLPAIMTGHIVTPAVASAPASISRATTTRLLRDTLNFTGMVVTDALNMEGVQQRRHGPAAAVAAVAAGADVVLMPVDTEGSRAAIIRAVRDGSLARERLASAATSMVATLLEARPKRTAAPLGSAKPAVQQLVRRAVTSVGGPCRGRILPDRIRLVGDSAAVSTFSKLARQAGVTVVPDRRVQVKAGTTERRVKVRTEVDGEVVVKVRRKVIQLYRWETQPSDAPTVAVVDDGSFSGRVDVAIAAGRPYWLGKVSARAKIATFGTGEASLRAGLRVLMGQARATGQLPVKVAGLSRTHC